MKPTISFPKTSLRHALQIGDMIVEIQGAEESETRTAELQDVENDLTAAAGTQYPNRNLVQSGAAISAGS